MAGRGQRLRRRLGCRWRCRCCGRFSRWALHPLMLPDLDRKRLVSKRSGIERSTRWRRLARDRIHRGGCGLLGGSAEGFVYSAHG